MLSRIDDLLRLAAPFVPAGLVSPAAWARLGSIPDTLPPVTSVGAFECRLEDGADRVDFEACISAANGREALARWLASPVPPALAASGRGWDRVIAFLRQWADPASLLSAPISVVWLEFDAEERRATPPTPFLVFRLEATEGDGARDATARTVACGLEQLTGGAMNRATANMVLRCQNELPATGQLWHVAVRPAGDADLVRLIVRMPWHSIPDYLERLGWPGDSTALGRRLERLCPDTLMHSLNLDVGPTLGSRIGVEFYFPTSPLDDPRWAPIFDHLVAEGACSRGRRAQVSAWPLRSQGNGTARPSHVLRELMLKVLFEPGEPLRAKAYLPFAPRPLPG